MEPTHRTWPLRPARFARLLALGLLAAPLLAASLAAQEGSQSTTPAKTADTGAGKPSTTQEATTAKALQRVRKIFSAMDADSDGYVEPREAAMQKIRGKDFAAFDHDEDRQWSGDEFTSYYRELLKRAKQTVPAAVEAEVQRIQTTREEAAAERLQAQGAATTTEAESVPRGAGPGAESSGEVEPTAPAEQGAGQASLPVQPQGARLQPVAGSETASAATEGAPATSQAAGGSELLVPEATAPGSEDTPAAVAADSSVDPGVEGATPETAGDAGAVDAQRAQAAQTLERAKGTLGSLVASGAMDAEEAREIHQHLTARAHAATSGESEHPTVDADPAGDRSGQGATADPQRAGDAARVREQLTTTRTRVESAVRQGTLDPARGRELMALIDQRVRDLTPAEEATVGPAPAPPTEVEGSPLDTPTVPTVEQEPAPEAAQDATLREKHEAASEELQERAQGAGATREQHAAAQEELDERAREAQGSSQEEQQQEVKETGDEESSSREREEPVRTGEREGTGTRGTSGAEAQESTETGTRDAGARRRAGAGKPKDAASRPKENRPGSRERSGEAREPGDKAKKDRSKTGGTKKTGTKKTGTKKTGTKKAADKPESRRERGGGGR